MKASRRLIRLAPIPVAVLALSVAVLGCDITDPNDLPYEASEPFSHTVSFVGEGSLQLDGINGPIEVTGDPEATEVSIDGTRRVYATSRTEAEEGLDELEVRVSQTGNRVHVRTVQPDGSPARTFEVEYRIVVPEDFDLTIHHTNGQVEVTDIDGAVSATMVNGDAILTDLSGSVGAEVVNGRIDAELAPVGTALIDLTTVNGRIELGIPASVSAMLDAAVVNGTLSVSQLTLHDVVQTSLSLKARLGSGAGTIDLALVNGDIRVIGRR